MMNLVQKSLSRNGWWSRCAAFAVFLTLIAPSGPIKCVATDYAFLVGVSDYDSDTLKYLPMGAQEIMDFKQVLQEARFGRENILVLCSDAAEPTKQNIEDWLSNLCPKVTEAKLDEEVKLPGRLGERLKKLREWEGWGEQEKRLIESEAWKKLEEPLMTELKESEKWQEWKEWLEWGKKVKELEQVLIKSKKWEKKETEEWEERLKESEEWQEWEKRLKESEEWPEWEEKLRDLEERLKESGEESGEWWSKWKKNLLKSRKELKKSEEFKKLKNARELESLKNLEAIQSQNGLSVTDRLIVVLYGHGNQNPGQPLCFCPADARSGKKETQLSLTQIVGKLSSIPELRKKEPPEFFPNPLILIVNTCREQETASTEADEEADERDPFGSSGLPDKSIVLLACDISQKSHGDELNYDKTFFFSALLDGWRGEANTLTVPDNYDQKKGFGVADDNDSPLVDDNDSQLSVSELASYIKYRVLADRYRRAKAQGSEENQEEQAPVLKYRGSYQRGDEPSIELSDLVIRERCPRYLANFRDEYQDRPRWEGYIFENIAFPEDIGEKEFVNCRFRGCDFTKTVFFKTSVDTKTVLYKTRFSSVDFRDCKFSDNTDFSEALGTNSIIFSRLAEEDRETLKTSVKWPVEKHRWPFCLRDY